MNDAGDKQQKVSREMRVKFWVDKFQSHFAWRRRWSRTTFESGSLWGAIIAGGLASACCLGPIIVVSLGLGSASAFIAMESYRPWFATLTLALLIWAGWQYWMGEEQCAQGGCKAKSPVLLWLLGVIALLLLLSPSWLTYL